MVLAALDDYIKKNSVADSVGVNIKEDSIKPTKGHQVVDDSDSTDNGKHEHTEEA
ncbi:hypothetical protein LINGRAHAP2_LOCUS16235, partial [Linum grandiflorum]